MNFVFTLELIDEKQQFINDFYDDQIKIQSPQNHETILQPNYTTNKPNRPICIHTRRFPFRLNAPNPTNVIPSSTTTEQPSPGR